MQSGGIHNREHDHDGGSSSSMQFDLTVGWGKWETKLFSVDWSNKKVPHSHETLPNTEDKHGNEAERQGQGDPTADKSTLQAKESTARTKTAST